MLGHVIFLKDFFQIIVLELATWWCCQFQATLVSGAVLMPRWVCVPLIVCVIFTLSVDEGIKWWRCMVGFVERKIRENCWKCFEMYRWQLVCFSTICIDIMSWKLWFMISCIQALQLCKFGICLYLMSGHQVVIFIYPVGFPFHSALYGRQGWEVPWHTEPAGRVRSGWGRDTSGPDICF